MRYYINFAPHVPCPSVPSSSLIVFADYWPTSLSTTSKLLTATLLWPHLIPWCVQSTLMTETQLSYVTPLYYSNVMLTNGDQMWITMSNMSLSPRPSHARTIMQIHPHHLCIFYWSNGNFLFLGLCDNGLYKLVVFQCALQAISSSLWYNMLGHPSNEIVSIRSSTKLQTVFSYKLCLALIHTASFKCL